MEHDRSKDGHLIDTNLTPVYLLVGEHDPAAHDDAHGGRAAARNIAGLKYKEMKGLSRFAPTDDPMRFREELLPVLDEILDRERAPARGQPVAASMASKAASINWTRARRLALPGAETAIGRRRP